MKKIDLTKKANTEDFIISDKAIQANREKMGISNDQQKVVGKNINLSLPIKNKDNTIPFNVQLDAERKNIEAEPSITEASMDQKEVDFKSKDKKQVMDINVETQKYDTEHNKALKDAEGKKDTAFWDGYVGVQLEGTGQPTKVKDNIPASSSQLQNNPNRFKGKKVEKMVMASIKDADAMLFHIYATAAKSDRDLNKNENQQIIDINAGKMRIIKGWHNDRNNQKWEPHGVSPEVVDPTIYDYDEQKDPVIRIGKDGKYLIYESARTSGGEPELLGEYFSLQEARDNFPEAAIEVI